MLPRVRGIWGHVSLSGQGEGEEDREQERKGRVTYGCDVVLSGGIQRREDPGETRDGLEVLDHVVDGDSDGGEIIDVLVWDGRDNHVEVLADGGAATSDLTASEVEG